MREILKKTQSVCSICKGSVEAAYFIEDGRVFYEKNCFLHGKERTLVARRAEDYVQWVDTPTMNVPPMSPLTHGDPNDSQCPLHCGPCENHLQTPCCVVIDVTDRCNNIAPTALPVPVKKEERNHPWEKWQQNSTSCWRREKNAPLI